MRIISKVMLVSALACLGACGGGSSGGGGVAKIKGTWQPTSYMSTITCPGFNPNVQNTGSNVIWSMGTISDVVQTDTTTSCVILADVTGYTASARPGQSCLTHDALGDTINVTLTSYTFSLSADFQTAAEAGSGSAQVTFTDGTASVCVYSLSAAYHKIGA